VNVPARLSLNQGKENRPDMLSYCPIPGYLLKIFLHKPV
jgi:hypothetical protein